jgi:hypothetical protein
VYSSAEDVALVPAAVVARTWTVPRAPAGTTAVQDVAEHVTPVAAAPPTWIEAPARCVPVTVIVLPPAASPLGGSTPEMTGGGGGGLP